MDEIQVVTDEYVIPSSEIFRILLQDIRCIKMDLQEMGLGWSWTGLIWLRIRIGGGLFLVNAVINLRVPQNAGNFLTS